MERQGVAGAYSFSLARCSRAVRVSPTITLDSITVRRARSCASFVSWRRRQASRDLTAARTLTIQNLNVLEANHPVGVTVTSATFATRVGSNMSTMPAAAMLTPLNISAGRW